MYATQLQQPHYYRDAATFLYNPAAMHIVGGDEFLEFGVDIFRGASRRRTCVKSETAEMSPPTLTERLMGQRYTPSFTSRWERLQVQRALTPLHGKPSVAPTANIRDLETLNRLVFLEKETRLVLERNRPLFMRQYPYLIPLREELNNAIFASSVFGLEGVAELYADLRIYPALAGAIWEAWLYNQLRRLFQGAITPAQKSAEVERLRGVVKLRMLLQARVLGGSGGDCELDDDCSSSSSATGCSCNSSCGSDDLKFIRAFSDPNDFSSERLAFAVTETEKRLQRAPEKDKKKIILLGEGGGGCCFEHKMEKIVQKEQAQTCMLTTNAENVAVGILLHLLYSDWKEFCFQDGGTGSSSCTLSRGRSNSEGSSASASSSVERGKALAAEGNARVTSHAAEVCPGLRRVKGGFFDPASMDRIAAAAAAAPTAPAVDANRRKCQQFLQRLMENTIVQKNSRVEAVLKESFLKGVEALRVESVDVHRRRSSSH